MALTIGNWILIVLIALIGIGVGIAAIFCEHKAWGIAAIAAGIILALVLGIVFSWWHNNTAAGARAMKDYESNMNNGLNREITITAEDGRVIFHYEGKVDIETKHDGNANYILFESEEGYRHIIYYGVQDTVLIVEKPEAKTVVTNTITGN